jgi:hypothetical protein
MQKNSIKTNKLSYLSLVVASTLFIGCGSSSSGPSKNSGTGDIDLANYFPNSNISKTYSTVEGNTTKFKSGSYEETILVKSENNTTTITTTDDDGDIEQVIITDKNITQISEHITFSGYRHVNIGDTFIKIENKDTQTMQQSGVNYAKVTRTANVECTVDELLKEFIKGDEHNYNGDILKIKCIDNGKMTIDVAPAFMALAPEMFKDINGTHDNYDISYYYFKKGIGEIASINEDCIMISSEPKWRDDRKDECIEKTHEYEYYIEK